MIRTVRAGWGRGLLAVGLVVLVMLGVAVAWASPMVVIDVAAASVQSLRNLGFGGAVVFGVAQVFIALSGILPASLFGIVAGAIYGLVPGFLLAAVSTMVGATFAFLLTRSVFRPLIARIISSRPRLSDFDALVARDGWRLVCLLRVSPVMPFSVTSYMLGLSSIDLRGYTIGTLASLPALCGYVLIGTMANASLSAWTTDAGPFRWILLGVGGVATLVLILRLGQIGRRLGLTSPTVATDGDQSLKDDHRA